MRKLWLFLWLGVTGCSSELGEAPSIPDAVLPAEIGDADPTLVSIDLGVHALGSEIAFAVPEGTRGATIVGRAPGDFGFASLISDDGSALVDDYGFDGVQRFTSVRQLAGDREVSMLAMALPQSDAALPLQPGAYRLRLGGAGKEQAGDVALTLWLRQAGATHGSFDVRMFVASGVASDSYLEEVASRALDGFAGMSLGAVTVHALPDEARVVDDDAELQALFRATSGLDGAPSVDVIAVSDMSGVLGSPVGRASGIPAVGVEHGSELSGLAIEISGEAWRDSQVLRHEVGHLAGLFHTSDAYAFDPLSDTPTCDDVDAGDCLDAYNIMFPRPSVTRTGLSASQRRIVQGSTLYRALRAAPAPSVVEEPEAVREPALPPELAAIGDICEVEAARVTADETALLAFALAPDTNGALSKRALMLAGARGIEPLTLSSIAQDEARSEATRIGALRGLAALEPERAQQLARMLTARGGSLGLVARGLSRRPR